MHIVYEELHYSSIRDADLIDLAELKKHLTERGPSVDRGGVQIAAMRHHLMVARMKPEDPVRRSKIVGVGMLIIIDSPFTGREALIGDVVVLKRGFRGQGIGRTLSKLLLGLAVEVGAKTAWLRSAKKRTEAHALYRAIGFKPKDSVVYSMEIPNKDPA